MTEQQKKSKAQAPAVTHVTTKPNAVPLMPIDKLRVVMAADDYMKKIQNYYGGNKEEAMRFMTGAIDYVRRVPKLLGCTQISLMTAFVTSAQFRFMPSGVSGEAYVIPYGSEAKFQLGYQGIITLLYRSGKVSTITANIVYENDKFDYEEGLTPVLSHRPAMFGNPRGEAKGVYTVAQMTDGSKTFKVMDKEAILGIKELSKAKNSKDSPWNSDQDPELWMWKKTCLIQHAKLLPKTQELQRAIEKDYEGEGSDRGSLDAGSPAAQKAFHNPEQSPIALAPAEGIDEMPPEEPEVGVDMRSEEGSQTVESEINVDDATPTDWKK